MLPLLLLYDDRVDDGGNGVLGGEWHVRGVVDFVELCELHVLHDHRHCDMRSVVSSSVALLKMLLAPTRRQAKGLRCRPRCG